MGKFGGKKKPWGLWGGGGKPFFTHFVVSSTPTSWLPDVFASPATLLFLPVSPFLIFAKNKIDVSKNEKEKKALALPLLVTGWQHSLEEDK